VVSLRCVFEALPITASRRDEHLDTREPFGAASPDKSPEQVGRVSEAIPRGGAISNVPKIVLEAHHLATALPLARKINECLREQPEARFFRADERDRPH